VIQHKVVPAAKKWRTVVMNRYDRLKLLKRAGNRTRNLCVCSQELFDY
jgi:hypothetical protein